MTEAKSVGRIVKVAGPVVDVEFPPDGMPEILHAIKIDFTLGDEKRSVLAEVAQHLGGSKVRAIALAPTDGLTRGAEVRNTGGPITVPVGDQTLGHIFNVWGDSLDAPGSGFLRPALADPSHTSRLRGRRAAEDGLRDRDQGPRPDLPIPPGREDRAVRRRRCRQDGAHPGDDQPGRHPAWRRLGVRRRRRADP